MKQVLIVVLTIVVILGASYGKRILDSPVQVKPFPYTFSYIPTQEALEASKASILIVGDRLAGSLEKFLPPIIDKLSENLAEPLSVHDWSENGEGLHRTLMKIKSLPKFPAVVLYLGATQEYHEVRYDPGHRKAIHDNWKRYQDDKISSLIISFPVLSKVLYKPIPYVTMGKMIKPRMIIPEGENFQDFIKTTDQLFKEEFLTLIEFFKENDAQLIVIAPPQNLDIAPRKVCGNSTSHKIQQQNFVYEEAIKKGQLKSAIKGLQELGNITLANAKTWYLLGQALKKSGLYKDAKSILYRAQAFDCGLWRGHMGFNKTLITSSEAHDIEVVDFNRIVNSNYGENILFFDEVTPQNIYYERLVDELEPILRRILEL